MWNQHDNISNDNEQQLRTTVRNPDQQPFGKPSWVYEEYVPPALNVYRFLELLKEQQQAEELNLLLLLSGQPTRRPQKKCYKKASEKLATLRQLLDAGKLSLWDFCGKCAAVAIGNL